MNYTCILWVWMVISSESSAPQNGWISNKLFCMVLTKVATDSKVATQTADQPSMPKGQSGFLVPQYMESFRRQSNSWMIFLLADLTQNSDTNNQLKKQQILSKDERKRLQHSKLVRSQK